MCDHKNKTILVDKDMHEDSILDTIFHEKMHEFVYQKRLKINSEEDFCFVMEKYIEEILELKECSKRELEKFKEGTNERN